MNLSHTELIDLADLAIDAVTAAGEMIASSRPSQIERKSRSGSLASQVVTEIDRRSEAVILETLKSTFQRFRFGMLTEEQPDDGGRISADYFWCIDPLDGTLPFVKDTPGYAVSVALVRRDGTSAIGVVYDPVGKTTLHAIVGHGVFRNGQPWKQPSANGTMLSLFTDESFLSSAERSSITDGLEEIARDMGLTGLHVDAGSGAVMNACKVLANPLACYVKLPKPTGGGCLWDYAATACIFAEAGAIATDTSGRRFDLNRVDSTQMCHRGILFASNEILATQIQTLCRAVR